MKLVIVGLILAITIAATSFVGGYMYSRQDTANRVILQTEHKAIAEKLQSIDEKSDDIAAGVARIEALLNRFMPKTAFENDR